jgi:Xaa-Pro aminopeptidase
MNSVDEISTKLEMMRTTLKETGAAGIRLRGTDWFAWATAGGSNTVLLAAEAGVAEVLVTPADAWILTDEIEAQRLQDEQLPKGSGEQPYTVFAHPWFQASDRESFVQDGTNGGPILSDRPSDASQELALPDSLLHHKRVLLPSELERYRSVGRLASEAMTDVLTRAEPDWTEHQLAGAGAEALWARGLDPTLTLAAGDRRLPLYRHPLPSAEPIGRRAMLVFCARGYGLYANLTRFVYFGSLSGEEANGHRAVQLVEAAAFDACQPGAALREVYGAIAQAYTEQGYPNAIREHHQGGTTGYLSREVVANPATSEALSTSMAIAWNPSLVGAKIEDTFVLRADQTLENLTFDPNWQSTEIKGRLRPLPLER